MRKITEAERQAALDYVLGEPEYNIFIIGDLENFSLDGDTVEVFVQDGPGGPQLLAMRYLEDWVVYSRGGYDARAAAGFFRARAPRDINGKGAALRPLLPYLAGYEVRTALLARLDRAASLPLPSGARLERLGPEAAGRIIDLYLEVAEFAPQYRGRAEEAAAELALGLGRGGRCCGAFVDGRLAAVASTSAENSVSAMVTGVATHPEYRGRGLASAVVSRLCAGVLAEGRQFLCLFYDNPAAGRIYRRIGFREQGEYLLLRRTGAGE